MLLIENKFENRNDEALSTYESTINVLQIEFSLRMNRNKERNKAAIFLNKMKKTVRLLITVFINSSIIFEQQENYSKTLEALK